MPEKIFYLQSNIFHSTNNLQALEVKPTFSVIVVERLIDTKCLEKITEDYDQLVRNEKCVRFGKIIRNVSTILFRETSCVSGGTLHHTTPNSKIVRFSGHSLYFSLGFLIEFEEFLFSINDFKTFSVVFLGFSSKNVSVTNKKKFLMIH